VSDEVGIEIARELGQGRHGTTDRPQSRWDEPVEILEVVVLAVVAISIAWSGYQAARWDGLQAELYGKASTTRIDADQLLTLGGQQRLLDVSTFNTWIQAKAEGSDGARSVVRAQVQPRVQGRLRCVDPDPSIHESERATRAELHA